MEALEGLSDTTSLVLLKDCERDEEYGTIFRGLMEELVEQVGPELRDDLYEGRTTIVASSPGRVTSYHIDAEVNFLFQVRGRKLLHVFDPNDPAVLPVAELEAFYGGDVDGARYKKERQGDARVFVLEPGVGVHMPIHAPHWAQGIAGVSVGVSFNFNLRSGERLKRLYKVNDRLRRAGLSPALPGKSPLLDGLKLVAFAGASVPARCCARS